VSRHVASGGAVTDFARSWVSINRSHAELLDQGSGVGEPFRVLGSREPTLAGQGSVSEGPPQAKVFRRLVLMVDLARDEAHGRGFSPIGLRGR